MFWSSGTRVPLGGVPASDTKASYAHLSAARTALGFEMRFAQSRQTSPLIFALFTTQPIEMTMSTTGLSTIYRTSGTALSLKKPRVCPCSSYLNIVRMRKGL